MNPETNRMEPLTDELQAQLERQFPDRERRPIFALGEILEMRGYRWRVAKITRKGFMLKGVGPVDTVQADLESKVAEVERMAAEHSARDGS